MALPPVKAPNHEMLPELVASKVTVPASQRETSAEETVGIGFMVAITAVRDVEGQPLSNAAA